MTAPALHGGPAPDPDWLVAAHHAARAFYRQHLPATDGPRRYLTDRGLGMLTRDPLPWAAGVAEPWYLGYAPPGWTSLVDRLTRTGFSPQELLAGSPASRGDEADDPTKHRHERVARHEESRMSTSTPIRFRLFYVDDSGSHQSGIVVYSWLECDAAAWRDGLQSWLDLREWLHAHHAIPPDYPLHAAPFAAGRGNPSTDPTWNRRRGLCHHVLRAMLAHLAITDGIHVGTVYRRTTARREAYAQHRAEVYQRLVAHLDTRLARQREHGLVLTDGDGTDASYAAAHHDAPSRR